MALKLRDVDYLPDGAGDLLRAEGTEALLQRVLFRLTARRGEFPILPEFGSQLWRLGSVPAAQRHSAAVQYVTEALLDDTGQLVESVALTYTGIGGWKVTAELTWEGQTLPAAVTVTA